MIKISKLTKVYSGGHKAVDNIDLEVKKGEIFGFLGPNGAGKTTTIKVLTGILTPTYGEIMVNGIDVNKNAVEAKKQIGYVADEALIMDKLTGVEYLNFIADIFEVEKSIKINRLKNLLKHFKLEKAVKDPISSYSHGMKQKISLIATLMHNPQLWILDEPIIGLDAESAFILKKMMRKHAENGNTVFFSTHVMEIAEKTCDRLAIINQGKILFSGNVKDLQNEKGNKSLESIFLEVTKSEHENYDFSYLD